MAAMTKLRLRTRGNLTEVDALVLHAAESGKDLGPASSRSPSARYIERMTFSVNDRIVAEARMGPGVSARPMAGIGLINLQSGDRIGVTWTDSEAQSGHAETTVS